MKKKRKQTKLATKIHSNALTSALINEQQQQRLISPVLSIQQTCTFTGLGRGTIVKLIKEKKIDAKQMGRRVLVLRASLYEYLARLPKR
jgi:excisionase family DNA binding protein